MTKQHDPNVSLDDQQAHAKHAMAKGKPKEKPKGPPMPPCPVCKTSLHVNKIGLTGETFHCGRCGGLFDPSPDEGGDFFSDPSKRLELQDEREQARIKRLGGRRR
jgi:hypothetical protein